MWSGVRFPSMSLILPPSITAFVPFSGAGFGVVDFVLHSCVEFFNTGKKLSDEPGCFPHGGFINSRMGHQSGNQPMKTNDHSGHVVETTLNNLLPVPGTSSKHNGRHVRQKDKIFSHPRTRAKIALLPCQWTGCQSRQIEVF